MTEQLELAADQAPDLDDGLGFGEWVESLPRIADSDDVAGETDGESEA